MSDFSSFSIATEIRMFDIHVPYNPLRCQIDLKAFGMSPLVWWP